MGTFGAANAPGGSSIIDRAASMASIAAMVRVANSFGESLKSVLDVLPFCFSAVLVESMIILFLLATCRMVIIEVW